MVTLLKMPRILDVDSDNRFWHNVKPISNVTDQVAQTTTPIAPISGSMRGTVSPFGIPGDSIDYLSVNRLVTGTLRAGDYINVNDKAGISAAGITGADVRIWAGDTWANRAIAKFRVTDDGDCTAGSFTVGTDISILDFQFTGTFSATDNDTVAWTSGTLTFSNGETFAIGAGNTGNISALTYIYFDKNVSGVALQTTTAAATANGNNKKLIAAAENNTNTDSDANFQAYGGSGGVVIPGSNIARYTAPRNALTIPFDVNRMPNKFADFEQYANGDNIGPVAFLTATADTAERLFGTKSMKLVNSGTTDEYVYLGASTSDYNIRLEPSTKYLVSMYAKGNAGGEQVEVRIKQDNGAFIGGSPDFTLTTSWARHTIEMTTTAGLTDSGLLRIDSDTAGSTIWIDAIQIEEAGQAANPEPTGWKPGAMSSFYGENIVAETITANEVKAATLTADRLNSDVFDKGWGSGTRTTAASTGTQVITGVGFEPGLIRIKTTGQVAVNGAVVQSDGHSDGSTENFIGTTSTATVGNCDPTWGATVISVVSHTGAGWTGTISAIGSDGFTISWTKSGAGLNVSFEYLCTR
jgi:hypothetical protein